MNIELLLITFLAFALRLLRLDFQPLWGDEGWSLYFATLDLPHMLALTAEDIHPPFYYALLHLWIGLAGSTPVAVRLFSVGVGTLTVPLLFLVGRRLFGPSPAALAAFILALAPFHVYYSQEVRMYGLVTLLGLASTYLALRLMVINHEDTKTQRHKGIIKNLVSWCLGGFEEVGGGRTVEARRRLAPIWVGYVCVTALTAYTQYYGAFIPLFQTLFVALNWSGWRRRGPAQARPSLSGAFLRRWLVAQAAWLALYVPWLLYAALRLREYVAGKVAVEGYRPADLLSFLGSYLGTFATGHLPPALMPLHWASALFLFLAALGLLAGLLPRRRQEQGDGDSGAPFQPRVGVLLLLGYLLVPLLAGWVVNLRFAFAPAHVERILLLAAPPYYLLVALGMITLWRWLRPVGLPAIATLIAVDLICLASFYGLPRYTLEDYRPLAAQVAALARPQDVILCSYQWQIGYFESYLLQPRPALYTVPGWGDGWSGNPERMSRDLEALLAEHGRIWFPAYQGLGHVWEDAVEAYLSTRAYPVLAGWYSGDTKLSFYVAGATRPAGASPVDFFQPVTSRLETAPTGRLRLGRYRLGEGPFESAWGVVPVELHWQMEEPLSGTYQINLRLADAAGHIWAMRDSEPVAGLWPFARWAPGEEVDDRHGLLIPAGTPPGRYDLQLRVYRVEDRQPLEAEGSASSVSLGQIEVVFPTVPPSPQALPIQRRMQADFAPAGEGAVVRFLGYSSGEEPYLPGQVVPLTLFWQALADGREDYRLTFELRDEGGIVRGRAEAGLSYPAGRWHKGDLLRDRQRFLLPADLAGGRYHLAMALLRSNGMPLQNVGVPGWPRSPWLTLAEGLEVTGRLHNWQRPAVQHPLAVRFGEGVALIGYDLQEETAKAGDTLHVTLYWKALVPMDRSYTVFVHLLDPAGAIQGQQDRLPGGDGRAAPPVPTTGWVPGEYLSDRYEVTLGPNALPGSYLFEVGLYDAGSGERLPAFDALNRLPGDRVLLSDTPLTVR
jgi:hypothetical protein